MDFAENAPKPDAEPVGENADDWTAFLAQAMSYSRARDAQAKRWQKTVTTWESFCAGISPNCVKGYEQVITQGPLFGETLSKKNILRCHFFAHVVENGTTLASVEATCRKRGWAAVLYMLDGAAGETLIAEDAFERFNKRPSLDDTAAARSYLVEVLGFQPGVAGAATFRERRHSAGGVRVVVAHPPIDRFVVIRPLDCAYDFATRGTQSETIATWCALSAMSARDLGVVSNKRTCDPAWCFPAPRSLLSREYRSRVVDGVLVDVEVMVARLEKESNQQTKSDRTKTDASTRRNGGFMTPGMGVFLATDAKDFEAKDWFASVAPEDVVHDYGHKADCCCPNADAHSEQKPGDRGFCVWNASGHEGGFYMHCMHNTCIEASNNDRAWFLDKECQKRGVKHASELRAFCPNLQHEPPHTASSGHDGAGPAGGAAGQAGSSTDDDFERDNRGSPYKSAHNIRLAQRKLGVWVRYDVFANVERVRGLAEFADDSELDDAALVRLWIMIDERFRFRPAWDFFCKTVEDNAYLNRYNPVDEYLSAQTWDGTPRIDTWLIDYMGAADTALNHAAGRLWLIAAARRARKPGTKFDQMIVFEDAEGTGKSTAFATLAVKDEWFTDQVPLTASYKDVQELLAGIWIAEMGELAGLRKADVEPVKVFLARRHDRGRGAYKRKTKSQARTCVFGGSTNDAKYLKSTTGNRRFWPVKTGRVDLAALRRDRDQIWAEAAKLEAEGVTIVLDEALWSDAAEAQNERRTENPYTDELAEFLNNQEGGLRSVDVWKLLRIPADRQHPHVIEQVHDAMLQLGWGTKKAIKWRGVSRKGFRKGKSQDLQAFRLIDGATWEVRVVVEPSPLTEFAQRA